MFHLAKLSCFAVYAFYTKRDANVNMSIKEFRFAKRKQLSPRGALKIMLLDKVQNASTARLNSWVLSSISFERFPNVIEQWHRVVDHVCLYGILWLYFVQYIFSDFCMLPQADKTRITV